MMLPQAIDDRSVRNAFAWNVPARFNWAGTIRGHPPGAPAILCPDAPDRSLTFGALDRLSNKLANLLRQGAGLGVGDRVAILLGQRPEAAIAHLACAKAGLIALPLFRLFGPDALQFRLEDSTASVLITDRGGVEKIAPLRASLPHLQAVFCVDGPGAGAADLTEALDRARDSHPIHDSAASDPATLIYTSGTTGAPKGALLPYQVLLGHLPGVQYPHWPFPSAGDRFWTPADWAWIGGLYDVLLPALYCGVPVVAQPDGKFDPEAAFALIESQHIRNSFLPPSALKLMRAANPDRPRPGLRSVGSGGEALGEEMRAWGEEVLQVPINEFYGQTECNLIVSSNAALGIVRAGAIGKAVPGHELAILDASGRPVGAGDLGEIAVRAPDPVMFAGYWNRPKATAEKIVDGWLRTGDLGQIDEDGYIAFKGRTDDLINSSGYRIGPSEVEDCLLRHPSVAAAAVFGLPDPARGELVAACVVLRPGTRSESGLPDAIQDFVRTRLAAHAYPRVLHIVDALPLTATGKVMRRVLRDRYGAGAAQSKD